MKRSANANYCRGRYQPRRHMDDDALNELVQSIKEQGIISPIVVRQTGDNQYEIIAGGAVACCAKSWFK